MTLVFNELSAGHGKRTRNEAMDLMSHMVRAIAALVRKRAPKLMTVESFDLFGMMLAEDYSLGAWLQDPNVEPDDRRFFLIISTKVTFDREVSAAVKHRFLLSEFHAGDRDAPGIGLSYLLRTVAISLRSHERWMGVHIPIRHRWFDEHTNLHEAEVVALNIADREQASTVTDEMANRAQAGLAQSPRTLLTVIRPSFPHLSFGLDVEGQIATLPADVLDPIITKLVVLDGAIRDWRRDGPKLPGLPMIHPESEQTMQRYGAQRVFRSSNGKQATFRLHAMVGGAYRIHVRIDQRRRSLEIGYIGKHLPTARFPT